MAVTQKAASWPRLPQQVRLTCYCPFREAGGWELEMEESPRKKGGHPGDPHLPPLCLGGSFGHLLLARHRSTSVGGLWGLPCHLAQVTAAVSQAIFICLDSSFQSISSSLRVHDCHLNHVIFSCSETHISVSSPSQGFATVSAVTSVSNHTYHQHLHRGAAHGCPP